MHIDVVGGQRRVGSVREVVDTDGSTIVSNEIIRTHNGQVGVGYPLREETRDLFASCGFDDGLLR